MPQIDIALKSTADVGGFTKTAAASQELQRILGRFGTNVFTPLVNGVEQADRQVSTRLSSWDRAFSSIAKKFSGGEIAKQFLGAVGLGGGMAIAERAASLIAGHWEEAAKAAESVAASSERQLAATLAGIKARQTDAQRVQFLETERNRLEREAKELRKPKTREVSTKVFGDLVTTEKPVEQTEEQKTRLAEIATELQTVGNEIDALNRKINEDTQKKFAEKLKTGAESAAQNLKEEDAARKAIASALERQDREMESLAEKYRELGDHQKKYRDQLAEVDTLERAGRLSAEQAAAARLRINAEMNDTAGKAIRAARDALAGFDEALAKVDASPSLTNNERHRARLKVLQDQEAAIARLKKSLEDFAAANPGVDVGAISSEIRSLNEKAAKTRADQTEQPSRIEQARTNYRASQQDGFQTFGEGVQGGLLGYLAQLGTMADQVAAGIQNTLGAAVSSISQGIYGWITGTMSFRQVLMNLGQTVLQTLLQSVIQIGVRMLLNAALSRMLTAAAAATAIATAAPTAVALSAIWAGPATLATIATLGGAAAQAPASMLAAKATVFATSIAGFADGVANLKGPGTSTSDSILARLSVGESVLTARTTSFLGEDFINQLNADPVRAIARPYQAGESAGAGAAASRGESRRPMTAVFFDRDEMRRFLRNHPEYDADIVDVMRRNRGEIIDS